jgi:hypothetical protein
VILLLDHVERQNLAHHRGPLYAPSEHGGCRAGGRRTSNSRPVSKVSRPDTISAQTYGRRYGTELIALCHSFQNAEREVAELFLVLRALWFRIQRQILVLRNVEVSNCLGEELQYLQMQMLGVLQSKLQELTTKIDKLANAPLFRRCVHSGPARRWST